MKRPKPNFTSCCVVGAFGAASDDVEVREVRQSASTMADF